MPVLTWTCAHGDSPSATIPLAATTAISPDDDSVDSNNVIITGTGTISSFGACSYPITKQVVFGAGVTLAHSAQLVLLTGGTDRVITGPSVGTYQTHGGDGVWTEVIFSTLDTVDPLVGSVNALESQVATLQSQVGQLQAEVAQLATDVTQLFTDINNLQSEITTNVNNIATNANNIAAVQNQLNAVQANHAAWINHLEANVNNIYALNPSYGGAPSSPPSTPP